MLYTILKIGENQNFIMSPLGELKLFKFIYKAINIFVLKYFLSFEPNPCICKEII